MSKKKQRREAKTVVTSALAKVRMEELKEPRYCARCDASIVGDDIVLSDAGAWEGCELCSWCYNYLREGKR